MEATITVEYRGQSYDVTLASALSAIDSLEAYFYESQDQVPYARKAEIRAADERTTSFSVERGFIATVLRQLFARLEKFKSLSEKEAAWIKMLNRSGLS